MRTLFTGLVVLFGGSFLLAMFPSLSENSFVVLTVYASPYVAFIGFVLMIIDGGENMIANGVQKGRESCNRYCPRDAHYH